MYCIVNYRCYQVSYFDFETVREASDVQHADGHYRNIPLSFDFFVTGQ